jgi:glucosylceramidase
VIARPETDEVYFTPMYHVMAQFSRYLRPGARRIGVVSEPKELMVTAVENPDGGLAAVILNQHEAPLDYVLRIGGRQMDLVIPGAAIQTVVVKR